MFLSRFGVKNYKCLGEIDIPLTPIHVLIGQNDAGKTSLLEAMAAFYDSSRMQASGSFPSPWSGRDLVFHGGREPIVELSGEWRSDWDGVSRGDNALWLRYGFSCEFLPEGSSLKIRNEWIENAGGRQDFPPGANPVDAAHTELHRWRGKNLGARLEGQRFERILTLLDRVDRYSLDAKAMSAPSALDPGRRFRLNLNGSRLPALLDDILVESRGGAVG
jgi:hypothetical protein